MLADGLAAPLALTSLADNRPQCLVSFDEAVLEESRQNRVEGLWPSVLSGQCRGPLTTPAAGFQH